MSFLKPGEVFAGRYRIEREIARGGMGVVYAAEHVETEQPVALKAIFPSVLASDEAVESFKLEARVAARLDNEHVVRVLDAGIEPESRTAFLAMELLSGRTLADLVAKKGPLEGSLVAAMFRDLAIALDRAHRYADKQGELAPIVHRDLKPENLFVAQRPNGEPILKVLDFGIAKVLTNSAHVSVQVKGTPLFMAYEQLAGDPVTPQTDIWSLGLIAFQLLTGKHYWKAAMAVPINQAALFAEILHGPLAAATRRAEEIGATAALPEGFDAWFAQCVVREPDRRFRSAGEAASCLRKLLGAPDTASLPVQQVSIPSATVSAERAEVAMAATVRADSVSVPSRRRPLAVAAAAGVIVLGAGAFLLFGRAGDPASAASTAPPQAPSEAPAPTASIAPLAPSASAPEPAPAASLPVAPVETAPAPAPAASATTAPVESPPIRKSAPSPAPLPTTKKAGAPRVDSVWGER